MESSSSSSSSSSSLSQTQRKTVQVDHFCLGFLRAATATTSCWIEFLDFLQPTITTFYMVLPSESAGADYLCQIVKLHPLPEIPRVDLVLGGDATHPAFHSSVVTWQTMQVVCGSVRPRFRLHGAWHSWHNLPLEVVGNERGDYGQQLGEFAPCDTTACDSSEFTTTTWW